MRTTFRRRILYLAFTLSGFSGLIYESIWSRYLGLFLGHAAYAQTLVLAIYMGGIALGSWLCSQWSARWRNLLRGYALIEGLIGLLALVFHETFSRFIFLFFEFVIPRVDSVAAVTALKWGSAALLILPQSVLLGMTFPLMSGGIIRRYPENPGHTLSMLYFCNSIGGVAGVLASGFILIGFVGLPGTVRFAGGINVGLALFVWLMAKAPVKAFPAEPLAHGGSNKDRTGSKILLLVALFTGTASFIYEIGWIRMLSMVLGSSTHSFELMLSAFILGLALGGFWIRRRIDKLKNPVRFLAVVQIAMGILALSTLSVYGSTFNVMQWVLKVLPKTEIGYLLFNLSSHGIAMAVMLPTTFCAGMTLPLINYVLLQRGLGESSIGRVYSVNTVGAIVGVVFAVHFGMPFLGLKNLMAWGAIIDISLGLLLFAKLPRGAGQRLPLVASVLGIAAIVITLGWVELDSYRMASGVFRRAQTRLDSGGGDFVLSHADGKTATVDTVWQSTRLSIRTNGKIDASVNRDPSGEPTLDESTMVWSGALPIMLHPNAKTAANIGMGSGLTSQLLLTTELLSQVDTVEIEQAMVEAAKHFRPRNTLVFSDPRSRVYIEDAKTFFSTHRKKYDIIVSEPSNPWVSGVAGLFSTEFYDLIARHLNEGGLMVQWLQLYEIDVNLVASVLKALSQRFTDYHVYAVNDADILIVGRIGGAVPDPDFKIVTDNPKLAAELRRVRINGIQDIEIRKIGNKRLLEPWLVSVPIVANSDYYPKLDVDAEQARFLNLNAAALLFLRHAPLPILEMLEGFRSSGSATIITSDPTLGFTQSAFAATLLRDYVNGGVRSGIPRGTEKIETEIRKFVDECISNRMPRDKTQKLVKLGTGVVANLQPIELQALWQRFATLPCGSDLSEKEERWFTLFKAIGNRDAPAIGRIAEEVLAESVPAESTEYLVGAAMLSHRVQRNHSRIQELRARYNKGNDFGPSWRLLMDILSAEYHPQ